jgi:hypothetical protein
LKIWSGGRLRDLSPLRVLPFNRLHMVSHNNIGGRYIYDLSSLQGLPLESIRIGGCPLVDLRPLKGMPLQELDVSLTAVSDLSPLEGLPLESIGLQRTFVTDFSPLKKIKMLKTIDGKPATDLLGVRNGDTAPSAARIEAAKGFLADGGELRIAVGGVQKVLKAPEEVPNESFSTMHITLQGDAKLIEEQVARIVILNDVTRLELNGPINIADLERIGRLPKLEALILWGFTFSASDLDGVRGFAQVKELTMGSSHFKGKPDLANFTALEEFYARSGVSDVTGLSESSNLKSIFFFASHVTDEGLNFTTPPAQLEYIRIDKCNHVTDACLIHLGRIKTLRTLHICNTKITRTGVESLRKQLPLCQIQWGKSYDDRITLPPLSETDKPDN